MACITTVLKCVHNIQVLNDAIGMYIDGVLNTITLIQLECIVTEC